MPAVTFGTTPEAKHNLPNQLEGSDFPSNLAMLNRSGHGRMFGWGDTVPADADTGWGKGALYQHTNGVGGDDLVYQNNGSITSAAFIAITSVAGADFGATGIKADAIAESTSSAGVTISDVLIALGGTHTLMIDIGDNTTYTMLTANSGKVHTLPDLTADIVITLPTAAAGLFFEFWYAGVAADAADWQFDSGSDTNFFLGGLMQLNDSDANVRQAPDGNSNSKANILTPDVGTIIKLYCDGTNWILSGFVNSATADAVTWADQ